METAKNRDKMSEQGPNKKVLAEVLLKLSRSKTVTPAEAKEATKEYNKLDQDYQLYKNFYEENKGSYANQLKTSEETSKGNTDTGKGKDPPAVESNSYKKLKEHCTKLELEKQNAEKQVAELRNRLSVLTGQKITTDNPDIADLSDPHRPTQLAEKFRQIYDDEWTHAFEELDSKHTIDEFKIIDFLTNIIQGIDAFCGDFSKEQIKQMQAIVVDDLTNPKVLVGNNPHVLDSRQTDLMLKMVRDVRKSFATLSLGPLIQIFQRSCMVKLRESIKLSATSTDTNNFVAKAVEILWLMKIQQPPMELLWQKEGEKYDKDRFTFYTKRGEYVKQTVWPAVLLHSKGSLMTKGILQAK